MATLNDITNAASYRGDIALGGGVGLALELDTKPIQQLAAYTLMYNKSQYDQRQKDADEKIKQLAAMSSYDLVNGIGKDKNELIDAQAKLLERRRKEAFLGPPKTPKEKMEREVSFQADTIELMKKIDSAGARKIKLDVYKNATQKLTNISAEEKELRIKQAEKLFDDSDIYTLPNIPDVGVTVPKISAPVIDKTVTLTETPNGIIKEQKDQWSFAGNNKVSYLEANNMMLPILPANATQQQKDEYEQKKLAYSKSDVGVWKMAEDAYANALNDPKYKKTETTNGINVIGEPPVSQLTETVDIGKIKSDNPIIGGILSIAERYNAYAKERISQIQDGYYIDKVTGYKVRVEGSDTVDDIKIIDVTKPISDADLIKLQKFAEAAPDKVDKVYTSTDNAIQKAQIAATIQDNKADQYLKGRQLKLDEDKWKASQVGGQTQINGAMERAKRIYSDMLKIADSNGIISPDKIRQLNVEQLKYLGIEVSEEKDKDGKTITAGGFKPLSLSGKKYGIQLVDGKINVFGPREVDGKEVEVEVLKDGRLVGNLDNTKSTNLNNMGTNILNEELKIAGGKEVNAYMGVDVTGGITTNTDGGTASQSGSTKAATTELSADPKDWKQEGKNYRYKDGTLYDAKGNIIK